MINCQEATMLSSKRIEEKLGMIESFKLKLHLMLCKPCSFFAKQVEIINSTLKKISNNSFICFSDQKKNEIQNQINKNL